MSEGAVKKMSRPCRSKSDIEKRDLVFAYSPDLKQWLVGKWMGHNQIATVTQETNPRAIAVDVVNDGFYEPLAWTGEVDKVQLAINRLRLNEPKEGYYVAFSGGKDSCVVLDLCNRAGVKYDAHYALTTVDPPVCQNAQECVFPIPPTQSL